MEHSMANLQTIITPVPAHRAVAPKAHDVLSATRVFKVAADMLREAGFSRTDAAALLRDQWGATA
jgi:hypothetical protein